MYSLPSFLLPLLLLLLLRPALERALHHLLLPPLRRPSRAWPPLLRLLLRLRVAPRLLRRAVVGLLHSSVRFRRVGRSRRLRQGIRVGRLLRDGCWIEVCNLRRLRISRIAWDGMVWDLSHYLPTEARACVDDGCCCVSGVGRLVASRGPFLWMKDVTQVPLVGRRLGKTGDNRWYFVRRWLGGLIRR